VAGGTPLKTLSIFTEVSYTEATRFFDYQHPAVQDYLSDLQIDGLSTREKAIALYNKVRDGFFYNPFLISISEEDYVASTLLSRPTGHCIDKSVILVSLLRSAGIPARIQLAKVQNHIGVERLVAKLGTSELAPHGFVEMQLDDKWIKATPAFNKSLCEMLHVAPLEFDGVNDSIFQAYEGEQKFMEYLEDYGHFDDLPFEFIVDVFTSHYGHLDVKMPESGYIQFEI